MDISFREAEYPGDSGAYVKSGYQWHGDYSRVFPHFFYKSGCRTYSLNAVIHPVSTEYDFS